MKGNRNASYNTVWFKSYGYIYNCIIHCMNRNNKKSLDFSEMDGNCVAIVTDGDNENDKNDENEDGGGVVGVTTHDKKQ